MSLLSKRLLWLSCTTLRLRKSFVCWAAQLFSAPQKGRQIKTLTFQPNCLQSSVKLLTLARFFLCTHANLHFFSLFQLPVWQPSIRLSCECEKDKLDFFCHQRGFFNKSLVGVDPFGGSPEGWVINPLLIMM